MERTQINVLDNEGGQASEVSQGSGASLYQMKLIVGECEHLHLVKCLLTSFDLHIMLRRLIYLLAYGVVFP